MRRLLLLAATSFVAVLATAAPASAHQPVFLGDTDGADRPVEEAPLLVDGTISFAIYGMLESPDATASVQAQLQAGDPLHVELLVPAVPPELEMDQGSRPVLEVVDPTGRRRQFEPSMEERFDEPFTSTSYLRLARLDEEAIAGTYTITAVASAPTRYTLVVGEREVPGEVRRYEAEPMAALAEWYATPAVVTTTTEVAPMTTTTTAGDAEAQGGADGEVPGTGDDGDSPAAVLVVIMLLMLGLGAGLSAIAQRLRRTRPPEGPGS